MYLTITEVSQRTKLSESSIRRLCQRDEMPSSVQLIGRLRVWSEEAIENWMRKKIGEENDGRGS